MHIVHTVLDSVLFRVSLRIVFHGYKSRMTGLNRLDMIRYLHARMV